MLSPRIIAAWLLLFSFLCCIFVVGVYALPWLFVRLSHRMPENYRYLAREHMQHGEYLQAEDILRRRLAQEYYDFEAQHLLAQTQAEAGRLREAVATMEQTLQKIASSRGRNVRARGFDEANTYQLLGTYLCAAGEYVSGEEMLRAAIDCGASRASVEEVISRRKTTDRQALQSDARLYLKLQDKQRFDQLLQAASPSDSLTSSIATQLRARWTESVQKNTTAALTMLVTSAELQSSPPLLLAAIKDTLLRSGVSTDLQTTGDIGPRLTYLDLDRFSQVPGVTRTSSTLRLARTLSTTGHFDSGVYRTTSLLIRATGTSALGMYPIIVLRSAETELARLYLDGLQPTEYDLELWPQGAPKSLQLTMTFENDASDPVTGDDRNVDILEMALH